MSDSQFNQPLGGNEMPRFGGIATMMRLPLADSPAGLDVGFGDFAENIATEGIDWKTIPVGTQVRIGETALLEITQIGKECVRKCAIYYQTGDCIMPREGIFARVLEGGMIHCGDDIDLL